MPEATTIVTPRELSSRWVIQKLNDYRGDISKEVFEYFRDIAMGHGQRFGHREEIAAIINEIHIATHPEIHPELLKVYSPVKIAALFADFAQRLSVFL